MLRNILIPLDGSDLARAALDVATRIVDSTCQITLVTAVQVPEYPTFAATPVSIPPDFYPTLEMLKSDAKQYLEEIAEPLRQSGYHVSARIEVGDPAEQIIMAGSALNADLIVMSTHGRTGIKRWFFGSVASRVLNLSSQPVLVVPNRVIAGVHGAELAALNIS
jgi:nucleotide-binding universal stress UspA family protein